MKTPSPSSRAFGWALLFAAFTQACGSAAGMKGAEAPPTPPVGGIPGATATSARDESAPSEAAGVAVAAAEMPAPAPPPAPTTGDAAHVPTAANPPDPDRAVIAEAKKMVDIEARLSIEVSDVQRAANDLRKLVAKRGGQITSESITATEHSSRAEIALRVPAHGANELFDALDSIGVVRSRQINAKDIGKEFFDATLRLANLEAARKRFEELLGQAKNLDEVLRLESELGRLRQQIEQLKGEIRWMRDRAARATVYVTLITHGEAPPPVILEPEAKLFPGVRGSFLRDVRGKSADKNYFGAGLIIGVSPRFSLEVQGLRALDKDAEGLAGAFVTLNGRVYSEFFGDGGRSFLNPYLGFRGGYARFLEKNEALLGGAVGFELVKTKRVVIDTEFRSYALFGSKAGGHVGLEPTLGAIVAF